MAIIDDLAKVYDDDELVVLMKLMDLGKNPETREKYEEIMEKLDKFLDDIKKNDLTEQIELDRV